MKRLFGVALLALMAGALLGFKAGVWSLDNAYVDLAEIKETSKKAEAAHQALVEQLRQELSTLGAEQQRKARELDQAFQAHKLALQASLADTANRRSRLEARMQQSADELARTRRAQESAAGAHQEELRKKEQELQAAHELLEQERAGVACLSIVVPGEEVRILNRDPAHAERAQR